jgi:hypothetical protein
MNAPPAPTSQSEESGTKRKAKATAKQLDKMRKDDEREN